MFRYDLCQVVIGPRGMRPRCRRILAALQAGNGEGQHLTSMRAASISGSRNSVKSGSLRAQSASERWLNRFSGQGGG